LGEIVARYDLLKGQIAVLVDVELAGLLGSSAQALDAAPAGRVWSGGLRDVLTGLVRGKEALPRPESDVERHERVLRQWSTEAQGNGDPLRRAVCRALSRVVSVVRARHGRVWGDAALLAPIVTGLACNDHCSEEIGRFIDPLVRTAAQTEGYRLLPAQERPVVMNTKGASASGKSTLRPLQKRLAGEIGVQWGDFALISPDIWRKYLLDYASLGEHFRYAGAFTGHEIAIIDAKLDRHMANKARCGAISHLLIDRFRFDSYAPDSVEAGSNLLTRFGRFVHLFFMITPPHETVERSWKRGLEVGRYKAVDDLLAHNIEAYAGTPELFFTWALRSGMSVHYEFLDNSVRMGERPRTVAFGRNGEMTILDVKCMLDIDRYRKIDVNAKCAAEVYPGPATMGAASNTRFLQECARRLSTVSFADRDTGRIFARLDAGRLSWTDADALRDAVQDPETRAGILAVAPEALADTRRLGDGVEVSKAVVDAARFCTLGEWGGRR
jgi:hypothetical protein